MTQSLASDQFHLLGGPGIDDPPLLPARKMSDWDTYTEVFGWTIDTESQTITLSEEKVDKLQTLIEASPRSRLHATIKEVES